MSVVLYGIKNCDTVRKARQWLDSHGIEYQYHDFRLDGLKAEKIHQWLGTTELNKLVNKRSTTWRNTSDEIKFIFDNNKLEPCIEYLVQNPTLIKRPVLEINHNLELGFSDNLYSSLF